jgi:hypothetical protein
VPLERDVFELALDERCGGDLLVDGRIGGRRRGRSLAEMSETRKRLIPEASRDYNFGAQLRLPARTFLDSSASGGR